MTSVADDVSTVSASSAFIGSVNLVGQLADKIFSFGQIVLIAAILGASPSADLFFLASIVPLTIGFVVGEPVGRAALTVLVREQEKRSAISLAASMLILTLATTVALTAGYDVIAIVLVKVVTPSGSSDVWPWIAFSAIGPAMALGGLLSGILTWQHEYSWAASRVPLASLSGLALLGLTVSLTSGLTWIALAIGASYIFAFLVLMARVTAALGRRWWTTASEETLRTAAAARSMLIGPAVGGAIGGQVIVTIERILAGTIGPGAVASISYARGIGTSPVVFAQAVGVSGYPRLVHAEAAGNTSHLRESLLRGLRLSVYLGAIFAVFLVLFGPDAVAAIFQRGAFVHSQSTRVGSVLVVFAVATFTGSVIVYLVSVIYGIGRFGSILWLELTIFLTYIVAAPIGLVLADVRGLAYAFAIAQGAGMVAAVALASNGLDVKVVDLSRHVLRPVTPLIASVFVVLVLYRLAVDRLTIPLGLRGDVRVGGGLACLFLSGVSALLISRLPEATQMRRLLLRRSA
jgi:putative peptidoglycan lipid II flippase